MNIEMIQVKDLISYPSNPKAHPADQVAMIAESIRSFGFKVPLVVTAANEIVAGHGRKLAAQQLQLDKVPCIRVHDLTDDQVRAFRIADNKSAESDWIEEFLEKEIKLLDESGYDVGWMGFSVDQLKGEIEQTESAGVGEKPEVEFAQELLLEHNYIVLYFDNPFDWQVAMDKFGLKKVKDLIPRKAQPTGIGRVVPGAEWLERIK